jgi:5-formyltetrahydrofolate cyclo-ligase
MDIVSAKKALREKIRSQLSELSEEDKRTASREIVEAVTLLNAYKKAKSLILYASTAQEIDTFPIMQDTLEQGKELWLPWCDTETLSILPVRVRDLKKDLKPGAYGILSPDKPSGGFPSDFSPAAVFVPGVAFDKKGNRLGRGLGYYDKFLAKLSPDTLKVGLAFQCQMVEEVPTEPQDVKMDRVISA